LEAGTPLIELLGRHLEIDMADHWSADRALLDLIKDREVLGAMVGEVAGEDAAEANAKATGKVKRQIVADCLNGINGRVKVERFVPRWMAFPPGAYTARGGVGTVNRAAVVEQLLATRADEEVGGEGRGEPVSEQTRDGQITAGIKAAGGAQDHGQSSDSEAAHEPLDDGQVAEAGEGEASPEPQPLARAA
jgi:ParB family chromosome partitioning protein